MRFKIEKILKKCTERADSMLLFLPSNKSGRKYLLYNPRQVTARDINCESVNATDFNLHPKCPIHRIPPLRQIIKAPIKRRRSNLFICTSTHAHSHIHRAVERLALKGVVVFNKIVSIKI